MQTVSVQEMQELDRRTIEDFGVPSIILMENAGRCVSSVAMEILKPCAGKRVAIFCGTGNNGGDGFVAARYLAEKNIGIKVYIVGEQGRIKDDPLINLNKLRKTKVEIAPSPCPFPKAERVDLVIDAILGIGVKGQVKEPVRSIIADLNKKDGLILSVDVPSGLDADTGEVLDEAIKATKTVTMQFPKKGFYINDGPEHTGEIIVADIGILG